MKFSLYDAFFVAVEVGDVGLVDPCLAPDGSLLRGGIQGQP